MTLNTNAEDLDRKPGAYWVKFKKAVRNGGEPGETELMNWDGSKWIPFEGPDYSVLRPSEIEVISERLTPPELEGQLKKFVFALALKVQQESRLLHPNPQHFFWSEDVLDTVHEIFGIPKETLGDWLDQAPQKVNGKKR